MGTETCISFFVPGLAKPGGSKRAFMRPGMKYPSITDDCKGNKNWRAVVAVFARQAYQGPPLTGPLSLTVRFMLPRPQSHFRGGRQGGRLREDAPHWHTKKPDCTKLLRALEDACTSILWVDDSQIAHQEVEKVYAAMPGAMVTVRQLDDPAAGVAESPTGEKVNA